MCVYCDLDLHVQDVTIVYILHIIILFQDRGYVK